MAHPWASELTMARPSPPPTRLQPRAQAGTSHNLGDNFARAFETQFLDESGTLRHPHQSSFGMSTRMIGGVIMTHGDDAGLRLPPRMASVQVGPRSRRATQKTLVVSTSMSYFGRPRSRDCQYSGLKVVCGSLLRLHIEEMVVASVDPWPVPGSLLVHLHN